MSKKILVTGATGMLGLQLVYQLTENGDKVHGLYRSESKLQAAKDRFKLLGPDAENRLNLIEWVKADLFDVMRLEEVMHDVHKLYHCAALVSFDGSDKELVIKNNQEITANVMNTAIHCDVTKVLHVSSVAALGRGTGAELKDEATNWTDSKENSAYARSKYLSELEAWRAHSEGLNLVVINPSIIIGPGDWETGSSALIGKVANGFKFFTEGVNAYVDVRDVARSMIQLMNSDVEGERFVIMSENKTYKQVFEKAAKFLSVKPPSINAERWMGEIVWRIEKLRSLIFGTKPMVTSDTVRASFQKSYYSNKKIKELLNFQFISIEDSLRYHCELYQRENSLSRN